ncbi:MAG: sulfotransferase [Chloroflexia bacterium]|nr:sulfotransferase [Chloroflexia bacterium]
MPVCIAGMHRSGTSMVAKLLHESGLYLGPDSDLIPPGPGNPEGFWENRRFVQINSRILKELRGGWDYPPSIPEEWSGDRMDQLRVKAEAIVADFAGREPWGWKDPRNCLTLPFWQQMLDSTRVALVVRNPLETAESLRKRNGFSYALGLALWHTYYQRVCDAVAPAERIVTHYDVYFRDPGPELRRVLTFLDMPVDEDVVARASATLVAEARHYRLTTQDLRKVGAAQELIELYRQLCSEANWREVDRKRLRADGKGAERMNEASDRTWNEPSPAEFGGRMSRPEPLRGAGRLRLQLEEAQVRIAELEQAVEAQQAALAEREAVQRELMTLKP